MKIDVTNLKGMYSNLYNLDTMGTRPKYPDYGGVPSSCVKFLTIVEAKFWIPSILYHTYTHMRTIWLDHMQ